MWLVTKTYLLIIVVAFSLLVVGRFVSSRADSRGPDRSQSERYRESWCFASALLPPPSPGHDPRRPAPLGDQLLTHVDEALATVCEVMSNSSVVAAGSCPSTASALLAQGDDLRSEGES